MARPSTQPPTSTLDLNQPSPTPETAANERLRPWLRLSVVAAVLGVCASVGGLLFERIYERETDLWQSQSLAQDLVNLVAFPLMALLVVLTARGSLRAFLAWLGTLVFSTYTYAIYAFDIRFGPLFLVYVAILGCSAYALIGGMTAVDPTALKRAFGPTRHRLVGRALAALGGLFAVLWLSIEIPAAIRDEAPQELTDAGLATNPVHVLDLALLLPAVIAGGVLLARREPLGYLLAPVTMTALALLGAGIISIAIVTDARGEPSAWPIVVAFTVTTLLLLAGLRTLFAALPGGQRVEAVLRH